MSNLNEEKPFHFMLRSLHFEKEATKAISIKNDEWIHSLRSTDIIVYRHVHLSIPIKFETGIESLSIECLKLSSRFSDRLVYEVEICNRLVTNDQSLMIKQWFQCEKHWKRQVNFIQNQFFILYFQETEDFSCLEQIKLNRKLFYQRESLWFDFLSVQMRPFRFCWDA